MEIEGVYIIFYPSMQLRKMSYCHVCTNEQCHIHTVSHCRGTKTLCSLVGPVPFVDLDSLKNFQMKFGDTHTHTVMWDPVRHLYVGITFSCLFPWNKHTSFFMCRIPKSLGLLVPPAGNIC